MECANIYVHDVIDPLDPYEIATGFPETQSHFSFDSWDFSMIDSRPLAKFRGIGTWPNSWWICDGVSGNPITFLGG